jgi:hypothetical protein
MPFAFFGSKFSVLTPVGTVLGTDWFKQLTISRACPPIDAEEDLAQSVLRCFAAKKRASCSCGQCRRSLFVFSTGEPIQAVEMQPALASRAISSIETF